MATDFNFSTLNDNSKPSAWKMIRLFRSSLISVHSDSSHSLFGAHNSPSVLVENKKRAMQRQWQYNRVNLWHFQRSAQNNSRIVPVFYARPPANNSSDARQLRARFFFLYPTIHTCANRTLLGFFERRFCCWSWSRQMSKYTHTHRQLFGGEPRRQKAFNIRANIETSHILHTRRAKRRL